MERIEDISELEARLLYSVIVAGKNAKFANDVVRRWLGDNTLSCETPFETIRHLDESGALEDSFRLARTGNYGKVTAAARGMATADLDLMNCTPQDLEKIKGIGPKTSRFFIIWTRPDAEYAALDVHVLRWLGRRGYDVPKSTPQSSKRYAELETAFLKEAAACGKTPRELDFEIWDAGSQGVNVVEHPKVD